MGRCAFWRALKDKEALGLKVAVYVVAQGGVWQARISLNLAVDELWWAGEAEGLGVGEVAG